MDKRNKFKSWILASRPKTLPAAIVPVIVGSSLAYSEEKFILLNSLIALFCSLLIQIGTNFVNDLYDFLKGSDKKGRKGPQRVLANGLISVNEMKTGSTITFLLAFIAGLYLVYVGGIVILIIGIASIIAGVAYTAGPFPLAYNGLGDLFVFIFFGIVATMGTYYVNTFEFSILSFLVSIPVGALITNILLINNYRDINDDKIANKKTTTVIFGKIFTRRQYIFLIVFSYIIPVTFFVYFNYSYLIFLPFLSIPLSAYLIKMLYTIDGEALNKTLELTAKLSGLYGILFSIGLIL
ncbi:MAG: 1,4-dihydroxy-2-naphthoate polyprenyltransferase [Bacteroidetes bacterium]|nr:1,4-dihydroxy-2-naphthoate polyprenyltransferase [Bacteroidota bacterium]